MIRTFFLIVLSIALLTSCTTLPPAPPAVKQSWKTRQSGLAQVQSWQLSGKIAVITAQDSGSATVDWMQNRQQFVISLFGPLGMSGLKLSGQPGAVTLKTSDGKTFSASTPEELLQQQWGWRLPVSYLLYWVRGLPVPGIPQHSTFDTYQRLSLLDQSDWHIQYTSYTTHRLGQHLIELPDRISINSANFKTKIVIYDWKIN